jgi:hypothetical protein
MGWLGLVRDGMNVLTPFFFLTDRDGSEMCACVSERLQQWRLMMMIEAHLHLDVSEQHFTTTAHTGNECNHKQRCLTHRACVCG